MQMKFITIHRLCLYVAKDSTWKYEYSTCKVGCSNNNLGTWFDFGICFGGNLITARWRIKDFYNLCLMMRDILCLLKSHTHTHTSHSQIYWSCHSGWCEHCQRTPTQGWIVAGGSSLSQYPRGGWWCWQCSAWWSLMPLSCLLHSHLFCFSMTYYN